jgi:hypothetical protein
MTSSTLTPPALASAADDGELLPGYFVDRATGAWLTLPPFPVGEIPTIGYGVVTWVEKWAINHLSGDPWTYRPSQVNFIYWLYALAGPGPIARWLFRTAIRRGAKGTGKDPLMATLTLAELCGPTLPIWTGSAWVGRQHPFALVQIGANSEGQGRDVLMVANAMVDPDMSAEFGFDKGILRTQIANGSRIELLTTSEKSAEGDPATAVFLNETHHMTVSNGADRLAAVGRRNAGKSPGGLARVVEMTNTHMPGEDSVGEASYDAWQAQVAGRTKRVDILYDSCEAPPHLQIHDEEQLMEGLRASYRDAPWIDLERIASEALDLRTPLADSIRFYFSSLPTAETAWVDPRKFDNLAHPEIAVDAGEAVALFLDCSKSRDATTLCGARMSDGHVMALGAWQRPHGERAKGWLVPREEVDAKVRELHERYDVQWFGIDPSPAVDDDTETSYWAPFVDAWHRDFRERVLVWATPGLRGSAVSYDLRQSLPGGRERLREFTAIAEQTAQDIDDDASLTWDGDPILRLHVHNARRRPNQYGIGLGKRSRESSHHVDYAISMVGARLGRRAVLNSGKTRKRRTGRVSF